jgi:prophage maintenance system killer protein
VKNHPLPDGNKRCAFLSTVEFVERNGRTWMPAPGDPDETDHVIRAFSRQLCRFVPARHAA